MDKEKPVQASVEATSGNFNNNKELGEINDAYDGTTEISLEDEDVKDAAAPKNRQQVKKRETWDSPAEFLLSCIAMSVGLGNVWRFPFTAYENGGGAFLIPYLLVLLLIGRPIYFLELVLGQFSQYGPVRVWGLSPFFKGVGYSSAIGAISVMTFYTSIIAFTLFYLINSFRWPLPWATCDSLPLEDADLCPSSSNGTSNSSLSQLYYSRSVFPTYESIDEGIGWPHLHLVGCLALAWVIIYLALIKGVKSSGKVAYFTALFPYFVLAILLVRGVTLPGAWDGILYFITPRWEALLLPKVWFAAVNQCFFSLSTCFGSIIMFSSYNNFHHNVHRDAMIISLTDTMTSLLAGVTIFAVLGNLGQATGVAVEDVLKGASGAGLAFISYPEAIAKIGVFPQVFAVLFFLMLFALGIGSATSLAGGAVTIICDQWPAVPKWKVGIPVCIFGFIVGLLYITPGGNSMLILVDTFGASFVIYVVGMVEVSAVAWVYGLSSLDADIRFMLKKSSLSIYWKVCWGFAIPGGLIAILAYSAVTGLDLPPFPPYALACGWTLSAFALSFLPLCAIHSVWKAGKPGSSLRDKIAIALRPSEAWGPQDPQLRQDWLNFKLKQN